MNDGWKIDLADAEALDGSNELVDAIIRFVHEDGRKIEMSVVLSVHGEIILNGETLGYDSFPTHVDSEYFEALKTVSKDDSLIRTYFLLPSYRVASTNSGDTSEWIDGEPEEIFMGSLDMEYTGAFQNMPDSALTDSGEAWAKDYAQETLEVMDLNDYYTFTVNSK